MTRIWRVLVALPVALSMPLAAAAPPRSKSLAQFDSGYSQCEKRDAAMRGLRTALVERAWDETARRYGFDISTVAGRFRMTFSSGASSSASITAAQISMA